MNKYDLYSLPKDILISLLTLVEQHVTKTLTEQFETKIKDLELQLTYCDETQIPVRRCNEKGCRALAIIDGRYDNLYQDCCEMHKCGCEKYLCDSHFGNAKCEMCLEVVCNDCINTCNDCDIQVCKYCYLKCKGCKEYFCEHREDVFEREHFCFECDGSFCKECLICCGNCNVNICKSCYVRCDKCNEYVCDHLEKCSKCKMWICICDYGGAHFCNKCKVN
jgi:hypothetical protein